LRRSVAVDLGLGREMDVTQCGLDVLMSEQLLQNGERDAGFKQMGGICVAKAMYSDAGLGYAGTLQISACPLTDQKLFSIFSV